MGAFEPPRSGNTAVVFACTTTAALLLFGVVARGHLINADEGFYLAAGRDIAAGLWPYADFFFPQMPYLPYAEAALFELVGVGLHAGRALSVVPAALLAGVLAVAATRRTQRIGVGLAIAAAYALHALSLSYLTILKTYGLSNLLFTCALLLVVSNRLDVNRAALAGFCAGLAVGVRSPTVAVAAILFLWTWRAGLRPAAAFACGGVLAAVPLAVIAINDPQAFWFGNVGFHQLRREIVGFAPIVMQKLGVVLKWIFVPQNGIIWSLALVGWWRGAKRETCALLCAAALGAVYLWATPTYLEYMCQLIPLLLLAAAPAVDWLFERRQIAGAVVAIYLAGLVVALRPAAAGSARAAKNDLWRLSAVETVAEYLRAQTKPQDSVLSWWEGYPVLAGRSGFREVGFWQSNMGKKLPEDVRRRFHVAAVDDVRELVEQRRPQLIVRAAGAWTELSEPIEAGYERSATFGPVEVLRRRSQIDGSAASNSAER